MTDLMTKFPTLENKNNIFPGVNFPEGKYTFSFPFHRFSDYIYFVIPIYIMYILIYLSMYMSLLFFHKSCWSTDTISHQRNGSLSWHLYFIFCFPRFHSSKNIHFSPYVGSLLKNLNSSFFLFFLSFFIVFIISLFLWNDECGHQK